jgi:hypothetical protein
MYLSMELSSALSCSHESLLWGLAQSIPEKTLRSFPPLPFSGSLLLHSESFRKARHLLAEGSFTDCDRKKGLCFDNLILIEEIKIHIYLAYILIIIIFIP